MNRKPIPTTYDEARATLNGRSSRTVCNNTRLVDLGDGDIGLRLHSTTVVTFHPDGSLVLKTGGWHTVTTKDRLNRVIRAHGWSIFARDRAWYIAHRNGDSVEFEDGYTIPAPSREPRREDHCTHPEQGWCDCDWCRLLRAKPDARVEGRNGDTVLLVRALTDSALAWLEEHTDGQWLGNGLAVEHRYVADLVEGLRDAGFVVEAA